MKRLKNLVAWMEMAKLLLNPPALFHHLHSLNWYRGALLGTLPRTQADMPGASILEVGCATGDFCADLAEMGAVVHGVDRSANMVGKAKLAHRGPKFSNADVLSLPFEMATFDIVFAASLLNVLNDPVRALREMVRVCRPDGVVALLVPAAEFGTVQARCWAAEQGLDTQETAAYMAWHRFARKLSNDQLMQWIDEATLEPARVESKVLLGGLARVIHLYPTTRDQNESAIYAS